MLVGTMTAVATISGCGVNNPDIILSGAPGASAIAYNRIANEVVCKLDHAVRSTRKEHDLAWLENWGAKITLTFTAEERGSLSPGLTYKDPLIPSIVRFRNGLSSTVGRSFALGLEGNASSNAKNEESYEFFLDFAETIFNKEKSKCVTSSNGVAIDGDLGLAEWLDAAGLAASTPGTINNYFGMRGPYSSLSHKTEFTTTLSAGVNPVWNIVEVTANSTSPLLFATRKKTDFLLVTMGPLDEIIKRERQPSIAVQNSHLAGLIGQQVQSAIRDR